LPARAEKFLFLPREARQSKFAVRIFVKKSSDFNQKAPFWQIWPAFARAKFWQFEMKDIRRAERYFCNKNIASRGREKFPTGNLFVTESLTLRFGCFEFMAC